MSQAEDWLVTNLGLENFKGGFERARAFLGPSAAEIQKQAKVITVAGTNGKGQVACQLSELLERQGHKVARWTSPHILCVSERFYFSGRDVGPFELLEAFEKNRSLLSKNPSYYEFLFYVFCQLCLEHPVDVLILEVGLGGRLDAVNVFDADLSAITSISLDHQEILGSDLLSILQEKWGVARKDSPMLTALHQQNLQQKAAELSASQDVPWLDLFRSKIVDMQQGYWQRNLTLARVLASLFDGKSFDQLALERPSLNQPLTLPLSATKGRFEEMTSGGLRFIFVGAHNCDGLDHLVLEIEKRWPDLALVFDEVWISFSQRPAQEIEAFFESLANLNTRTRAWRYCQFEHPKALQRKNIDETKWRLWSQVLSPPIQDQSLDRVLREKPKSGTLLVTGSYYFIGEVQKRLL